MQPIKAVPRLQLFLVMADGFYVVAVGILHEPAVVVGVILRPETGLAVVLAARGQRSIVECFHGSPVLRRGCDMHGSARLALSQPKGGSVLGPETQDSVALVLHAEPERGQGCRVEPLA